LKRILLPIITIFSLLVNFAYSETAADYSQASVSIKFYDRTMYYPGSKDDNPIYVDVAITNKGTETLRFKLADDRMFSLDFYAYTIKNTTLPNTKDLVIKRSTNQTVYFRELAIEPGETYSFVENVKDYIQIDEPSIYYLELRFYPELYKSRLTEIASNRLSLDIRPRFYIIPDMNDRFH
jgi:hypothetical protein